MDSSAAKLTGANLNTVYIQMFPRDATPLSKVMTYPYVRVAISVSTWRSLHVYFHVLVKPFPRALEFIAMLTYYLSTCASRPVRASELSSQSSVPPASCMERSAA